MPSARIPSDCRITLLTPHAPGAVAMLQLTGNIAPLLATLTNTTDWPLGKLRLTTIANIDDGLVVCLRDDLALLMPHGGVRIVHQIAEAAVAHGATLTGAADLHPRDLYPEAEDDIEALMLAALARAESPLAIDLLLDQPRRWRASAAITEEDRARSHRLNHLIVPPTVVLAGLPNVGKSTLTNALVGRSVSVTADMPGTTRDYTAGRINIAGLVVDWHDTPGMRTSDDPIEQRSIAIAHQLFARADLIIAMSAPGNAWPALPCRADLFVFNKCDLTDADFSPSSKPRLTNEAEGVTRKTRVGSTMDAPLPISALAGTNIASLASLIREALAPDADLAHPGPWLFDERLLHSPAL